MWSFRIRLELLQKNLLRCEGIGGKIHGFQGVSSMAQKQFVALGSKCSAATPEKKSFISNIGDARRWLRSFHIV
jgi:hypothetical protein